MHWSTYQSVCKCTISLKELNKPVIIVHCCWNASLHLSDDNCQLTQLVDQHKLVANITAQTAYLQHLTMYSIYIQSSLLLIGYCFVARRRSAISLSSASTSCCFSSALLRRALAFVTNGNSPLFLALLIQFLWSGQEGRNVRLQLFASAL